MAFKTVTLYVLRNAYECGNCANYTRTIEPSDFPSTAIPNYSKLTNVKVHFEWRSNVAINATAYLTINGTQVGSNKTGTSWKNFDVESLQGYFNSQEKDTFRPKGSFVLKLSGTYRNWWLRNWYIYYEYYTPVFTITLPSNSNQGSYSGAGTYDVGTNATITATPKTGYRFVKWSDGNTNASRTVTIADGSQTAYETKLSYTAVFERLTYAITASAGAGGSISPSGSTQVSYGNSQTYKITPNAGYEIDTVTVDGVNQGAISSYTFSNVTAAHTISVSFKQVEVKPPEFTSASLTYAGSQVSASNKVPAGESCILSVGVS